MTAEITAFNLHVAAADPIAVPDQDGDPAANSPIGVRADADGNDGDDGDCRGFGDI